MFLSSGSVILVQYFLLVNFRQAIIDNIDFSLGYRISICVFGSRGGLQIFQNQRSTTPNSMYLTIDTPIVSNTLCT
jgi:hypothetical protein